MCNGMPGLLQFADTFAPRIWGGRKLRDLFGKDAPDERIGEDWLISDHPMAESTVSEGEFAGLTLHQIIERDARPLLGPLPRLTIHGRFPLLLKLLDAADVLSVQVHPDDECARRLGEPDVGKTEMWYVLQAEPGAGLISGLRETVTAAQLREGIDEGNVEPLMVRHAAVEGLSLFVPAGAVHAIGSGIVLAEIQQNSDLTYRLYDWNRRDPQGKPRKLHLEKAFQAIHFGAAPVVPAKPLSYEHNGALCHVLAACRHFAAEFVEVRGQFRRDTGGRSFHMVLVQSGALQFGAGRSQTTLVPGQCALVPGHSSHFEVAGQGAFLDYYVPDLAVDIIDRLTIAGHTLEAVKLLGADTF